MGNTHNDHLLKKLNSEDKNPTREVKSKIEEVGEDIYYESNLDSVKTNQFINSDKT